MSLTAFNKKELPTDLDTLKGLIDERQSAVETLRSEKLAYNETADKAISEAEADLKMLRIKAADIMGIPTPLKPREGIVERSKESTEAPAEVKEVKE